MASADAPPYHLVARGDQAQLWSTAPLPFDLPKAGHPRAWLRDMRQDLRDAIAGLRADATGLLHAVCTAKVCPSGSDVENALL